jgi:hypothetical protein
MNVRPQQRPIFARWIKGALSIFLMIGAIWSQEIASSLEILVQAGANRMNDDVSTWEIRVQVQDNNGRKIRGAAVVFQLPPGSGTFLNGSTTLTMVTDDNGQAVARGFRKGKLVGMFLIDVSASYNGLRTSTKIPQENPKPAPSIAQAPSKKWIFIGAATMAATGLGVYFGTRNNENTRTSVSLGPGSVSPTR